MHAYDEMVRDFPAYLDQSREVGCEIVGGLTWLDYARYVFPNLTVEEMQKKLAEA